ncbi:MAG: hypothetical protein IJM59_00555 [Proteobacteria bacterium]|nr:hypothetical protein [Pseudomonadota bacterium]
MSKSSKKIKDLDRKISSSSTSSPPEPVTRETPQSIPAAPPELSLRTLFGSIQTDLYERLLQPAMMSFGLRRDDEPLRQIVESIVTSIAMRDAYEGYRKIDDICQRYLYYLESLSGVSKKNLESIELNSLCDYWRAQVFMTLVRDSSAIFELLLPDTQPQIPDPKDLSQEAFLKSVHTILNPRLDPTIPISRETCSCQELYDFAHGISFPWTGYPSENLFGIQNMIPDEMLCVEHEFAMISAEQCRIFDLRIHQSLHKCLFIDLLFAQHHKLFDEICPAFSPEDILPDDFCQQLSGRVQFDKTYQQAFDAIMQGIPLTKPLHRASRLDYQTLNSFGAFASIVHWAAQYQMGVYLFHYLG